MTRKPVLHVIKVRRVPALSADGRGLAHSFFFCPASGYAPSCMRIRHAKPVHADDTPWLVTSTLGADGARLISSKNVLSMGTRISGRICRRCVDRAPIECLIAIVAAKGNLARSYL